MRGFCHRFREEWEHRYRLQGPNVRCRCSQEVGYSDVETLQSLERVCGAPFGLRRSSQKELLVKRRRAYFRGERNFGAMRDRPLSLPSR